MAQNRPYGKPALSAAGFAPGKFQDMTLNVTVGGPCPVPCDDLKDGVFALPNSGVAIEALAPGR